MSFRERPEYQRWREAVFSRFGRVCIRCGHAGNTHAHHVRPVNLYPEIAFDPGNGVPLCGNCHVAIKDDEMSYVEEFEMRQRGINPSMQRSEPDGYEREAQKRMAEANPSSSAVVERYFIYLCGPENSPSSEDANEMIAYYNAHRGQFKKSAMVYGMLAEALAKVGRTDDSLRVLDGALRCAEEGSTVACVESSDAASKLVGSIITTKLELLKGLGRGHDACAYISEIIRRSPDRFELHQTKVDVMRSMGRNDEAVEYLHGVVSRFPDHVGLFRAYFDLLIGEGRIDDATEVVRSARSAPRKTLDCFICFRCCCSDQMHFRLTNALSARSEVQSFARRTCHRSGMQRRCSRRLIDMPTRSVSPTQQSITLPPMRRGSKRFPRSALVYISAGLHDDALPYLQKVIEIDGRDPKALAVLADCNRVLGRTKAAVRYAKLSLMYDPDNDQCRAMLAELETLK